LLYKQGVALTGHNTTGPPCSVYRPSAALQTTTDADRRKRAKQYWPIRRVSNKIRCICWSESLSSLFNASFD